MDMSQHISDKRLEEKINDRIRWDVRVSTADVLIKVHGGKVTLFGFFDKPYRHKAVADIIQSTEGVLKFKDQSQVVKDYYRGDQEISSLITQQLTQFKFLDGEWIDVKSADGVVKLEGEVFRPELKAYASKVVWELSGVQDCINLVQISEMPQKKELNPPMLLGHFRPAAGDETSGHRSYL